MSDSETIVDRYYLFFPPRCKENCCHYVCDASKPAGKKTVAKFQNIDDAINWRDTKNSEYRNSLKGVTDA